MVACLAADMLHDPLGVFSQPNAAIANHAAFELLQAESFPVTGNFRTGFEGVTKSLTPGFVSDIKVACLDEQGAILFAPFDIVEELRFNIVFLTIGVEAGFDLIDLRKVLLLVEALQAFESEIEDAWQFRQQFFRQMTILFVARNGIVEWDDSKPSIDRVRAILILGHFIHGPPELSLRFEGEGSLIDVPGRDVFTTDEG